MMRAVLALFVIATALPTRAADIDPDTAAALLAEAHELRDAMLERDFEYVVKRMNPTVREVLGGHETLVELARQSWTMLEAQGMTFESYEAVLPTRLHETDEAQVVYVPTKVLMGSPVGKIRSTGYLVASRPNSGGEWTFIDGAAIENDFSILQALFPGLADDAKPPESTVVMGEAAEEPQAEGPASAAPATASAMTTPATTTPATATPATATPATATPATASPATASPATTTPATMVAKTTVASDTAAWDAARAAAGSSGETRGSRKYAAKMRARVREQAGRADRRCREQAGQEGTGRFVALVEIGEDGAVQQVLVEPGTAYSQCHASSIQSQALKRPPSAPLWIELNLGR